MKHAGYEKVISAAVGILLMGASGQALAGVGDGGGTGALRAKCRFVSSDPSSQALSLILSNHDMPLGAPDPVIQAGLYQETSSNTWKILLIRGVLAHQADQDDHVRVRFENVPDAPAFTLTVYDGMASATEHRAELRDTVLDDGTLIPRAELACFLP